jgi:hypothetical protein
VDFLSKVKEFIHSSYAAAFDRSRLRPIVVVSEPRTRQRLLTVYASTVLMPGRVWPRATQSIVVDEVILHFSGVGHAQDVDMEKASPEIR